MKDKKRIQLAKPFVGKEELDEIKKVLDSGYLTEGPVTFQFENEFADYVGALHAHAMPNCSIALEAALRAYGIGPGDQVVTSDFTYPISADVANFVGAEPVLVDIDPNTYNMDADQLEYALDEFENVKAVIPVSEFGQPLDPKPFKKLQNEHGFKIIEDAAPSLGARYGKHKTGSMFDMTAFSFHPRKILTTGEGGMLSMDDDLLSDAVERLKNFGAHAFKRGRDHGIRPAVFSGMGTNWKMPNILGAVGLAQLHKLDAMIEDRIEKAMYYNQLLHDNDNIQAPWVGTGTGLYQVDYQKPQTHTRHVYQTYIIKMLEPGIRDRVMLEMRKENIETQIGTFCLHLEPRFHDTKRVGDLVNAENAYRNTLALPLHHELTREDQERVISTLTETINKRK